MSAKFWHSCTCIPTTFVGRADTTSIPTTAVERHIPTKQVGMVYLRTAQFYVFGWTYNFGVVLPHLPQYIMLPIVLALGAIHFSPM